MNIALVARGFGWAGGIEFLRLICNGLSARQEHHPHKIFLLLPVANRVDSLRDVFEVVKRSLLGSVQRRRLWWATRQPGFDKAMFDFFEHTLASEVKIVFHDDSLRGLRTCLSRIGADIALPINGTLGPRCETPWIGYLYDFQHRYLLSNFKVQSCYEREIGFTTTLKDSDVVVVNSSAVKDDVKKFYPWADMDSVFSLPFSPTALADWFEALPGGALDRYFLPKRYFLISNQFWVHKDHPTAIRALSVLRKHTDIGLVCTGAGSDHRRANYMEEIKSLISELGLTDDVRLLGHIPKRDQIEIMKSAVAVVQPTLFEGGPGGGSVYDAVALGVPVVLSDIAVNREVVGKNVVFFPAGQSSELAARLKEVASAEPDRPTRAELLKQTEDAISGLGKALFLAIERSIKMHGCRT